MTILLVVGVGVVLLGALVLLLFPDRPGGRIAWQGAEVSSIGAGLPLIVVGIAAIAISGGVMGATAVSPSRATVGVETPAVRKAVRKPPCSSVLTSL